MTQLQLSYRNDQELPTWVIDDWRDSTGALIDFSTGYTFTLRLCSQYAPATTLLLKSSGITGTNGGATVAWAAADWSGLAAGTGGANDPGTPYVVYVIARNTVSGLDNVYMPGNPPRLTLYTAAGNSAVSPSSFPITVTAASVTVADTAGTITATDAEAALAELSLRTPRTVTQTIESTGDSCGRTTKPQMIVIGDSIVGNNESATTFTGASFSRTYSYRADGFLTRAMIAARQAVSIRNSGTTGDTTAIMLARFDTDVTPYRPQIVMECGGTNDVRSGVSAATIFANKVAMWNKAYAFGAKVIGLTVPPALDSTTGQRNTANQVNAWIREYARTNMTQFAIVDWYADMIDPLTGSIKTSVMDTAGIHPNSQGTYNMASRFSNAILSLIGQPNDALPSDNINDLDNFMNLPLLTGTTGSGAGGWSGVNGSGWFCSGACATSKVARSDGLGDWIQMVVSSGTASNLKTVATRWAIGDFIYAACDFETDASGWVDGAATLKLTCFANDGTTALHFADALTKGSDTQVLGRQASGILRTPIIQIPINTVSVRVDLVKVNAGTVRYGRVEVRKVV